MVIQRLVQSALLALLLQGGLSIPAPVGVVNDFAHVIPADEAARISQIANEVRDKSRGEIAVVTLADIGDRDPNQVGLQIGRQWKLGKIGNPGDPTRNAGAVILVVPKETSSDHRGHCYVATGNGAEGFITDGDAGSICRQAIPMFQQKDYGHAIELVTLLTAQRFAKEYNVTLDTAIVPQEQPEAAPSSGGGGTGGHFPFQLIFLGIILVFFVISNLGKNRRGCGGCLPILLSSGGGGWGGGGGGFGGGGGGGGGFGGFGGGGGFSGGGGGSSW